MRRRYDFFLERYNFGRSISVNMSLHLPDGFCEGDIVGGQTLKRSVATGITYTELDPFASAADRSVVPAEPLLTLTMADAQSLMDGLWHCGLRPSEGTGSAGSLAATERHLKDMQALTFDLLGRMPK